MPVCPGCKTDQKRRVNGYCPNCGQPVEVHDGRWFRTSDGSPNLALLRSFERLVSNSLSAQNHRVNFIIPRKSPRYRIELAIAERLIVDADYDLDMAKQALEYLFSNKRFNWKSYTSLASVSRDFTAGLAVVMAKRAAEEKQRNEERNFVQQALNRESIFK